MRVLVGRASKRLRAAIVTSASRSLPARGRLARAVAAMLHRRGIVLDVVRVHRRVPEATGVLLPEGPALCESPAIVGGSIPLRRNIERFPEIAFRVIDDAIIAPRASGFLTEDGFRPRRRITVEDSTPGEHSVPGFRMHVGGEVIIAGRRPIEVESAIFLGGPSAMNYYHWTTEHLPVLWAASRLPSALRALPLIVNPESLVVPAIREGLELFRDGREVITAPPWSLVRVRRLVAIDALIHQAPPRLLGEDGIYGVESQHRDGMAEFRAEFLRRLGIVGRPDPHGQRLHLARPEGARRRYNRKEMEQVLSAAGLASVDPSRLTLREQADLFRSAGLVCGPSGAAFTNLVFAAAPTCAVIWGDFASNSGVRGIWANLAALGGASAIHVPTRGAGTDAPYGDDNLARWSVDPRLVLEAIRVVDQG